MTITFGFIINLLIIFLVKVFDNVLSTSKTILIQKNKAFFAGMVTFVTQVIFYKLINAVSGEGGEIVIYIISFASALGTILALWISNKFSKDRMFINVIMCDDKKVMKELRDYLKENKITNLTTDGYTKEWKKTLAITVYAETREQSKLLDNFINNSDTKFKRIIQIN